MLQHIIDIDEESMRISLKHPRGALILFDFEAAFPSVSHAYLWQALRALGVPNALINALKCFYANNVQMIKVKGTQHRSITTRSGIRQGCPLSPLLFAVVADVLLRRLNRDFPNCMVRAFADDTAMVLSNFDSQASAAMRLFRQYGSFSGLHLNMPKTVVMPLWSYSSASFMGFLKDTFPEWSRATASSFGKYLGLMVGPGKKPTAWDAPMAKYEKHCLQWSSLPVGLFRGCQNYTTFVAFVLNFHAQLLEVPGKLFELESRALRRFNVGPCNWFQNSDLFNLSTTFGFPISFPSIRSTSLAAKLRVVELEAPRFTNVLYACSTNG